MATKKGRSRTKKCANTQCTKRFTYQRSTKKYCSPRCRADVLKRQGKQPKISVPRKEGITVALSVTAPPEARSFPGVRRRKNTAGKQLLNRLARHVGCQPKEAYFQHTEGGGGVLTWNTVSGIRQQSFTKAGLVPPPPKPKPAVAYAWDAFSSQPRYAA